MKDEPFSPGAWARGVLGALPWRRFSFRLLVAAVAIPFISTLLLGSVLLGAVERRQERRLAEENAQLAASAAAVVDLVVTTGRDLLRAVADDTAVRAGDALRSAELFHDLRLNFYIFERLALLDPRGVVIAAAPGPPAPALARHWEAIAPQAARGAPARPRLAANPDSMPLLAIAEPVRRGGEVVGMVMGEIRLWTLESRLIELSTGSTTYLYVVNEEGEIVAHPDMSVLRTASRAPLKALRARAGDRYRTAGGAEVLGASAEVPEMGWRVVVETPVREAFRETRALRRLVLALALLAGGLTAGGGALIVRGVTSPVATLVGGARRIGSGDLKARVEVRAPQELAELATEFNRMAERLARERERLKRAESIRALSAVGSVLSHEIRNPLNALAVQLELLRRELARAEPDAPAALERHAAVLAEVRRIERITSSYLEMVRLPGSPLELVAPNALLEDLARADGPLGAAAGVRVASDLDPSVPPVLADRGALFQALRNLVRNAIESMPGGGTLTLRSRRCAEENAVVLEIEDTGVGLDQEAAARAFDFRYTTKEGGSGLGLPVAEAILERHGGRLELQSTLGRGTCAQVRLPAAAAEEKA